MDVVVESREFSRVVYEKLDPTSDVTKSLAVITLSVITREITAKQLV